MQLFLSLVKGIAKSSQAGVVSSIAMQASNIFPDAKDTPVISLEGENRYGKKFELSLSHYGQFVRRLVK